MPTDDSILRDVPIQGNVPTNQGVELVTWWWVWLVPFAAGLAFAVLAIAWVKYHKQLRAWILEATGTRLRSLRWAVNVFLALVVAAVYDKVDLSALLDGDVDPNNLGAAVVTALAVVVYFGFLYFLWECEKTLEQSVAKLTREKELGAKTIEFWKRRVTSTLLMLRDINSIVGERWDRMAAVEKLAEDGRRSLTPSEFVTAIDPISQFNSTLCLLHRFIFTNYQGGVDPDDGLRVAYYEPVDGYLKCIASYDGHRPGCITNPNGDLAPRFKLEAGATHECLAVYCAVNAPDSPVMIPDAAVADADPVIPYRHFSNSQRNHIRSIAAYCCRRARNDQSPHPVITIDTNKVGFFSNTESASKELNCILQEFSLRLVYERDVLRIVSGIAEMRDVEQKA